MKSRGVACPGDSSCLHKSSYVFCLTYTRDGDNPLRFCEILVVLHVVPGDSNAFTSLPIFACDESAPHSLSFRKRECPKLFSMIVIKVNFRLFLSSQVYLNGNRHNSYRRFKCRWFHICLWFFSNLRLRICGRQFWWWFEGILCKLQNLNEIDRMRPLALSHCIQRPF